MKTEQLTKPEWRARLALSFVVAIALGCARAPSSTPIPAHAIYPGVVWDSITNPRAVGWSPAGLDSVRADLATLASTGFVAVVGGRILMSYGNTDTVTYLASVRKSVLSMLMGNYVRRGIIDLDKSLADLGMDDLQGLTAQEKQATVRDLLTARSGVYHPASNSGDDTQFAPPRGSQLHGAYYLYNNWDFNALGGAFERMTGRDITTRSKVTSSGPSACSTSSGRSIRRRETRRGRDIWRTTCISRLVTWRGSDTSCFGRDGGTGVR